MIRYFTLVVFVVFGCTALPGCNQGPKTVPVSGKVTYRGQPLQFGTVMFQPTKGPTAKAQIQSDGSFTLTTDGRPGAVLGEHQVRVACFENQAPNAPPPPADREPTLGRPFIPIKYNNFNQSGLTVTVTEDMKPVELTLQ